MRAIRTPSMPLKTMAMVWPYFTCTQTNTDPRQDRAGHDGERRAPVEGRGDDQAGRGGEFEDAERPPNFSRQRAKRWDILAYHVEAEEFHGVRRCIHWRGKDLQNEHTMFMVSLPPGARSAVSPHAMRDLN